MSIHAHKILNMMTGHSYTETTLVQTINDQFGIDAQFHTCSAQNMNAQQIVQFLKQKGKFMPSSAQQFTVDQSKTCDHEHPDHGDYPA